MAKKSFRINGRVVEGKTKHGVKDLKVEAWDKDLIIDDLVGSTTTNEQGAFSMEFDSSYFQELFLDRRPDLFFRIYRKNQLIKSTENSVTWNVEAEDTQVVIEVDVPILKSRRYLDVAVFDYERNPLPDAKVSLKPLSREQVEVINLNYDEQWRLYRAPDINPGKYLLQVIAEGFEPDQREVQVDPSGLKNTFILGKAGMPFYYRNNVKVPFEPPSNLLAVSIKPDLSDKDEEELFAYARELRLRPEEVGKQILDENVRVFRFPEDADKERKLKIQQLLSGHQLVRIVGPVIRIDNESVSFLTNELIVKFKVQVTKKDVDTFVNDNDLNLIRTIPYGRNTFLLRSGTHASYDMLDACTRIVKSELVEYAQPNLFTTAVDDFVPNDFLYGQQPHHQIINSEGAWDITTGDNDIIIAVVDSGCDFDHPDFTNDPALGWDKVYSPYDFVNMDGDPTSGTHGTKSSGIAAAIGDNNEGLPGVAYGCRLMPIRRPPGGTDINHADMYVWIAGFDPGWTDDGVNYDVGTVFPANINPGADIISNSFGYTDAAIDGIMKDALDFITTFGRGGKGCVVLFSVGNSNNDFTTYRKWAEYEKTIAVASSAISPPDAAEVKVSTSNYGSAVDVCAPGGGPGGGVETRTLSTTGVGVGDTAGSAGAASNDYDDFGQTSCACPQVAGVAALMLSINPDLTWVQVRQIIRNSAVQIDAANADPIGQWVDTDGDGIIDFSQWYGYGRIDARAAVQEAEDLVGVDPLTHIDTWIKENTTDIGDVPESSPYISPDVWVRNLDPAIDNPAEVNIHQSPIREQDNWVYANIRNRGTEDSLDVYVRISITRWAGTQYMYPDDFIPTVPPSTDPIDPMAPGTYLIGEVHIDSIPAGSVVTINTMWPEDLIPPATVTIDGIVYSWADSCLLVEVSPHDGPTPTGNHTWENNNLCQRNITIIDPSDDDDVAIAFVAGHRNKNAKMLNIRIDRKNLPTGVKLYFDYIDQGIAQETIRFLEEVKERPKMLDTCDLTFLTEAKGEILCSKTGDISPVSIAPKTSITLACCHTIGKTPRYRLNPVIKDNRTIFELPTFQKTYVPVPLKREKYQVLALIARGLRNLKKGEYQIDIYQEDIAGKTEGGVNFIIRK